MIIKKLTITITKMIVITRISLLSESCFFRCNKILKIKYYTVSGII